MAFRFYHADRIRGRLSVGQDLGLLPDTIFTDTTDRALIYRAMFPEGVTTHGQNFLLRDDRGSPATDTLGMIEFLAEEIRRASYPQRPSRFQSVFACKTIDEAEFFIKTYPSYSAPGVAQYQGDIWEVEGELLFEADMQLLKLGDVWLDALVFLHAYWLGQRSGDPFVELFLRPPVKVIRKVKTLV